MLKAADVAGTRVTVVFAAGLSLPAISCMQAPPPADAQFHSFNRASF